MRSRQVRHSDALILQGQQNASLGVRCAPLGAQRECMHMLPGYKCGSGAHGWKNGDSESRAKGVRGDSQAKVHEGAPDPLIRLPRGVPCKVKPHKRHHTRMAYTSMSKEGID